MGWRNWWGIAVLACVSAVGVSAAAQEAVQPDASVGAALRSLSARATDIFVGQVTRVTRKGGIVEVEFRVDRTLQGTAAGSYTMREWAGLWAPGQQRFWLGERAVVFMPAPSASGLASPVDGSEGVVPVLVQGESADPLVDVRRLSARVQRKVGDPLADVATASIALSQAANLITTSRKPVWREPVRRPLPPPYRTHTPRLEDLEPETFPADASQQPSDELLAGLPVALAPTKGVRNAR